MNLLIVGGGKGGSWAMRGIQVGAALGARVTSTPTDADWRWAELVILVKKAGAKFAPLAHRFGVPIVWDALDFWAQPADNGATPQQAQALLDAQLCTIRPALTIGATKAMAEACDGVYIPHHSWAGLVPTPARETVKVVAYQGGAVYLGQWAAAIQKACTKSGWTFQINPADLSTADIVVAFRDGQWDGWMCREWKSGVKLVNAMAAGRPFITQDSAACRELHQWSGSVIAGFSDLADAMDDWIHSEWRVQWARTAASIAPSFTVDAIAAQYRTVLASVQVPA